MGCLRWNRPLRAVVLAWLRCGAAVAATAAAPASELISAEAFYGPPDITGTALSPSGRWLAMTTGRVGKRIGLVVFDLKEWMPLPVAALYNDADIDEFHWVSDERLVYSVTDTTRGGGDQRWYPGLFSVRRDGTGRQELVKLEHPWIVNAHRVGREPLAANHELLHVPEGQGDEVIVGEVRNDNFGDFSTVSAKRLNVVTGRATSISAGAPPHIYRWLFDPRGEPRLVLTQHEGRGAVHWRAEGAETWRKLAEYPAYEQPFTPAFIDTTGTLYVTETEGTAGNTVLKRFDFAAGRPEREALVSTPGFDFRGRIVTETVGGKALGVRVITDAETTVWFDKRLAALQVEADKRLPGHVNRLDCRRCVAPDMTAVVYSTSDRDPGEIWVYQAEGERWRKVGNRRPGIDPRRMATVDFARFRARDGLEIPVWLTLPSGSQGKPRPAVVLVHGGPWVRGGSWQWDADAQFLASRGYVVIEPEFRGSTGYGEKLYRAGWRQWGRAMQDDVADALAWAVAKGHADASRVCIAGASYGGYATLMGLVRHPDLYRCGVAWAAVTDPRLRMTWRADSDATAEVREFSLPKLVGDPVTDAAMLDSVSPVLLAERIKAPVLLAFGGLDRRVPPVHGTRMRDALTAAGRPPQWVFYEDEGHGWYKASTRVDFAQRVEKFLAEHLK